jgi:site-specific DNA-methyltransferase (adenine-specific)
LSNIEVIHGDCLHVLRGMHDAAFDSIVTDPPAGISFMGKAWDGNKGGRDKWIAWMQEIATECLRVVKPGAHALVWALPRTSHWTATAWENAGWEVRDRVAHLFGTGFPKSLDVSKAIDKANGAEREMVARVRADGKATGMDGGWRGCDVYLTSGPAITTAAKQWQGWGTALKPACEDWWLLRKPLIGTVAQNVLQHGTGAINIDATRTPMFDEYDPSKVHVQRSNRLTWEGGKASGLSAEHVQQTYNRAGRWPANVTHDGSPEVLDAFAEFVDKTGRKSALLRRGATTGRGIGYGSGSTGHTVQAGYGDTCTAARFFYTAKATSEDRLSSRHPTVKPVGLMLWLVRLITPHGGRILDPFAGSGTTGMAAMSEGFDATLIEMQEEYVADIKRRISHVHGKDTPLFGKNEQPPDLFSAID